MSHRWFHRMTDQNHLKGQILYLSLQQIFLCFENLPDHISHLNDMNLTLTINVGIFVLFIRLVMVLIPDR
jgi:hypothetical protein